MTRLDDAAKAMHAGGEDAALRFYQVLAECDLVLLLEGEANLDADGGGVRPKVFDLSDGPMILAYDLEERLSATHGAAVYAALPGRIIAQQMLGKGLSLGLNLGTDAEAEMVLPPDAMGWLCDMLDREVKVGQAQALCFAASNLGPGLRGSLEFALSAAAGLITGAGLVTVTARDSSGAVLQQDIVAIFGAPEPAEQPLARAVSEAASFAGLDADALAVQFLPDLSAMSKAMRGAIWMFDLPQPAVTSQPVATAAGRAPGMDPDRPPKLR
jgi:hypothetical protein